ncbi:hypothetical protein ABT130_45350, partial [Streptosporangium sp. NPDC001681]
LADAQHHSRARDGDGPGDELGLRTALAAMRVVGTPPALSGPPLVVDIAPRLSQAVEPGTPTGLIGAFAELVPDTTGHVVTADRPELPELSGPGGEGRPLVLVVHDAWRHPWVRDLLARAVTLRPDAIVVETGVPGEPTGAVYVTTNGISRASARAVAHWLTTDPEGAH